MDTILISTKIAISSIVLILKESRFIFVIRSISDNRESIDSQQSESVLMSLRTAVLRVSRNFDMCLVCDIESEYFDPHSSV